MRAYALSGRPRIVLWVLAPILLGCVITAAVRNVPPSRKLRIRGYRDVNNGVL